MKQAPRLCRTGCGRRVGTARSFLCRKCFLKHAVSSGSRSSGNKHPLVHTGHSGNLSSKGILGNAGNRRRGKSKTFAVQAGAYKAACKKETLERVFERPLSREGCQHHQDSASTTDKGAADDNAALAMPADTTGRDKAACLKETADQQRQHCARTGLVGGICKFKNCDGLSCDPYDFPMRVKLEEVSEKLSV